MDIAALEPLLLELAALAAAQTLPRFRAHNPHASKTAAYDPVTEADRAAEAAIRRRLSQARPHDGILGEEYGAERPDAGIQWIIDPIDGTRAYLAGAPVWTTLIGLTVAGAPALGLIAQPVLGETYIGGPAVGARRIDRHGAQPIHTRTVPLAHARLATTDPDLFAPADAAAFARLRAACQLTRYGLDAYAMAQLAAGHIDLVAESGLHPWDLAGPHALVLGAGGAVTAWNGAPPTDGRVVLAASADLAAEAATLLS